MFNSYGVYATVSSGAGPSALTKHRRQRAKPKKVAPEQLVEFLQAQAKAARGKTKTKDKIAGRTRIDLSKYSTVRSTSVAAGVQRFQTSLASNALPYSVGSDYDAASGDASAAVEAGSFDTGTGTTQINPWLLGGLAVVGLASAALFLRGRKRKGKGKNKGAK